MATEKRLIDANNLSAMIEETAQGLADCDQQNAAWALRKYAIRDITDAPSVDAVEVVRCKDCEHYKRICEDSNKFMCMITHGLIAAKADDFCSYGERRTDHV